MFSLYLLTRSGRSSVKQGCAGQNDCLMLSLAPADTYSHYELWKWKGWLLCYPKRGTKDIVQSLPKHWPHTTEKSSACQVGGGRSCLSNSFWWFSGLDCFCEWTLRQELKNLHYRDLILIRFQVIVVSSAIWNMCFYLLQYLEWPLGNTKKKKIGKYCIPFLYYVKMCNDEVFPFCWLEDTINCRLQPPHSLSTATHSIGRTHCHSKPRRVGGWGHSVQRSSGMRYCAAGRVATRGN